MWSPRVQEAAYQAEFQLVTECVEFLQTLVKALYGSVTAFSIAREKKETEG